MTADMKDLSGAVRWLRDKLELQDSGHNRLLAMEGIRGLAVTLVFLQHFARQALEVAEPTGISKDALTAFRIYGNEGVELFYVLSGYLIYGALVTRETNFPMFMRRRVQRIYPAFLAAFTIYFGAVMAGPTANRIPLEPLALTWYLASNLLLLPGLFPFPQLMAVAWSLSYEMTFYFVCGAAAARFALFRALRSHRIAGILLLTALFMQAAWLLPWVPVRMLPFFSGMLLAEGVGISCHRIPASVGLSAPIIALIVTVSFPLPPVVFEFMHSVAFFLLCASCLAGTTAAKVFSWTPARLLGNMSYSYYLMHGLSVVPIAVVGARFLAHPVPAWLLTLALPVVFAVSLVPAFALFLFVERPFSLRPRFAAAPRAAV